MNSYRSTSQPEPAPVVTFDGAVPTPEHQRMVAESAAEANMREMLKQFPYLKRFAE